MKTVILCLVACTLLATDALADQNRLNSYLIKSRVVEDVPEALTILRRFIPSKVQFEERCERYAVLLHTMETSQVDQFLIAELGLASNDAIRKKFRVLDVESLRQLYIDGISKFLDSHVDKSMLDLVDCLSSRFRSQDARARSFLNGKELRDTIDQYKAIVSKPLELLLGPEDKRQALVKSNLTPSMRQTLIELFNDPILPTTNREDLIPDRIVTTVQTVPTQSRKVPAPAPAPVIVPSPVPAPAPAPAPVLAPRVAPGSGANEVGPAAEQPQEELSDEEYEYLARIADTTTQLYQTLPLESKLNDRCRAYSSLFEAKHEQLDSSFVKRVVDETANLISKSGPTEQVFTPAESTRESFLITLLTLDPQTLGEDLWIDLVDCVSQWESFDERVREFMNSPEQTKIFEELMQHEAV